MDKISLIIVPGITTTTTYDNNKLIVRYNKDVEILKGLCYRDKILRFKTSRYRRILFAIRSSIVWTCLLSPNACSLRLPCAMSSRKITQFVILLIIEASPIRDSGAAILSTGDWFIRPGMRTRQDVMAIS